MLQFSSQLPFSNVIPSSTLDISRVYAFADSYTDFGNLYKLTNHTTPDPKYYYEGRTSNGPTWIENFATRLETKPKVISFAYGGATSDNEHFPAQVPSAKDQVEKEFPVYHKKNLKDFEENHSKSLFVFAFGANDISHPNGDPKFVIKHYIETLRKLVSTYATPKILVLTTNGSRYAPFTFNKPEAEKIDFLTKNEEFAIYWAGYLKELRLEFPSSEFIDFDYRQFHADVVKKPNPRTGQPWIQEGQCLTPKGNSTTEFTICADTSNYIYWDTIHITTQFHECLFDYAIRQITHHS